MKNLYPSNKIYINDSEIPNAGRGVFAGQNIKKGEVIEVCPIIEIPEGDPSSPTEGMMATYVYFFGEKKEKALVPLGFGGIYNHSRTPNAEYEIDNVEQTITFTAISDIKKDAEISVNYNAVASNSDPLWFE